MFFDGYEARGDAQHDNRSYFDEEDFEVWKINVSPEKVELSSYFEFGDTGENDEAQKKRCQTNPNGFEQIWSEDEFLSGADESHDADFYFSVVIAHGDCVSDHDNCSCGENCYDPEEEILCDFRHIFDIADDVAVDREILFVLVEIFEKFLVATLIHCIFDAGIEVWICNGDANAARKRVLEIEFFVVFCGFWMGSEEFFKCLFF